MICVWVCIGWCCCDWLFCWWWLFCFGMCYLGVWLLLYLCRYWLLLGMVFFFLVVVCSSSCLLVWVILVMSLWWFIMCVVCCGVLCWLWWFCSWLFWWLIVWFWDYCWDFFCGIWIFLYCWNINGCGIFVIGVGSGMFDDFEVDLGVVVGISVLCWCGWCWVSVLYNDLVVNDGDGDVLCCVGCC